MACLQRVILFTRLNHPLTAQFALGHNLLHHVKSGGNFTLHNHTTLMGRINKRKTIQHNALESMQDPVTLCIWFFINSNLVFNY